MIGTNASVKVFNGTSPDAVAYVVPYPNFLSFSPMTLSLEGSPKKPILLPEKYAKLASPS